MDLKEKKCIPCSTYLPPLSMEEKKNLMGKLGPHWELIKDDSRLYAEFKFKNFKKALEFTNKIGEVAEIEKHHPDLSLGWGYCRVEIYTHTNNNLMENDFILAAKIDSLLAEA